MTTISFQNKDPAVSAAATIMAPHFVLYEHAAGYALFKLQEFEEVATFLPQVEESVTDVSKFSQVKPLVVYFSNIFWVSLPQG